MPRSRLRVGRSRSWGLQGLQSNVPIFCGAGAQRGLWAAVHLPRLEDRCGRLRGGRCRPTARTRRRSPPRCRSRTFPVHEGGGIVWVWLGTAPAPTFPELPFTALGDRRVWMTVTKAFCNWLQGVEATLDSAHVGTLHEAYIARWTEGV